MTPFEIISDQPQFLVINKAPGIAVHKDEEDAGLVMLVSQLVGYSVYPVHRLDKVTSGLMVLAKSSEVAAMLGQLFESRCIQKYYLALSDRKPSKKQGQIKGGMVKARRGAWKLTKGADNVATTRFFSTSIKPGLRAFIIKPLSGKTHQIRVALKSIASPILGDGLYSGSPADRTYLHAWQLSFVLEGKQYSFMATPQHGSLFLLPELKQQLELWKEADSLPWPE